MPVAGNAIDLPLHCIPALGLLFGKAGSILVDVCQTIMKEM